MPKVTHRILTKTSDKFSVNVDGAFGGVLSSGKISVHFFTESIPIPKEIIVTVDTDTKAVSTESIEDEPNTILREIVSSVSTDIDRAKEIYIWLGGLINQADLTRKESKNGSNV